MKPGVIKVNVNKSVCQGCRTCEAVCSLVHTDAVSPQTRGIQVNELNELGKFSKAEPSPQSMEYPVFVEAVILALTATNSNSGLVIVASQFKNT